MLQSQHLNVGVVFVPAERLDALLQRQQLASHALVAGKLKSLQPAVPLLGRVCTQRLEQTSVEH